MRDWIAAMGARTAFIKPGNSWENEAPHLRQLVLHLTFAAPLGFHGNTGCRTPDLALPFKVLAGIKTPEREMVRLRRLELPRGLAHSDLNAARLPIPPQPH